MPGEGNDPTHLSWMSRGACLETGGEQFFPDEKGSAADAKRICLGCEVKVECLDYALKAPMTKGIWGGKSPQQRKALRRKEVG